MVLCEEISFKTKSRSMLVLIPIHNHQRFIYLTNAQLDLSDNGEFPDN